MLVYQRVFGGQSFGQLIRNQDGSSLNLRTLSLVLDLLVLVASCGGI